MQKRQKKVYEQTDRTDKHTIMYLYTEIQNRLKKKPVIIQTDRKTKIQRERERQAERQKDRKTERKAERQKDRKTERLLKRERQTEKEIEESPEYAWKERKEQYIDRDTYSFQTKKRVSMKCFQN